VFRKYGLSDLDDTALANLTANIVSTLQGGCFFGSLGASWFADRLGRKPSLLYSAGIAIVGCIMQAAANGHLPALYVGRLVAGFGVGAASMITPLYVAENAPRAIRGALTGVYQLFVSRRASGDLEQSATSLSTNLDGINLTDR
jgi:MFS family permease